jgi:hypothetical protein
MFDFLYVVDDEISSLIRAIPPLVPATGIDCFCECEMAASSIIQELWMDVDPERPPPAPDLRVELLERLVLDNSIFRHGLYRPICAVRGHLDEYLTLKWNIRLSHRP